MSANSIDAAENSRLHALLNQRDAEIAELHGRLRRRDASCERGGDKSASARFLFPATTVDGAGAEAPAPAPWQAARSREPAVPVTYSPETGTRPLLRAGACSVPAPGGIPWAAGPNGFGAASSAAKPSSCRSAAPVPNHQTDRQRHLLDEEELDVTRRHGPVPAAWLNPSADRLNHLSAPRSARGVGVEVCVEIASDNKPPLMKQSARPGSRSPTPPPPARASPRQHFRRVGSVEHIVCAADSTPRSACQARTRQRGASVTSLRQHKSPVVSPRLRELPARPGFIASQSGSQPCSQQGLPVPLQAGSTPSFQHQGSSMGKAVTVQIGGTATPTPPSWHASAVNPSKQHSSSIFGQPQLWLPTGGQQPLPGSFVAHAPAPGHTCWRGGGTGGCGSTPWGLLPPDMPRPVPLGGACAPQLPPNLPPARAAYMTAVPAAGPILPLDVQMRAPVAS